MCFFRCTMPIQRGGGLPSDFVLFRVGYDGFEPKEILADKVNISKSQRRVTIAINTYYPELKGGYYFNKHILGVIQDALASLNLHIVLPDVFRDHGLVHSEERAGLEEDEQYLLATEDLSIQGKLVLWRFNWSGGGSYYSDKVIVDCILPEQFVSRLRDKLIEMFTTTDVMFYECETVHLHLP